MACFLLYTFLLKHFCNDCCSFHLSPPISSWRKRSSSRSPRLTDNPATKHINLWASQSDLLFYQPLSLSLSQSSCTCQLSLHEPSHLPSGFAQGSNKHFCLPFKEFFSLIDELVGLFLPLSFDFFLLISVLRFLHSFLLCWSISTLRMPPQACMWL